MKRKIELSPGDMLYKEETSAVGILICKLSQERWKYILRSPSTADISRILQSECVTEEESILMAIKANAVRYFSAKKT